MNNALSKLAMSPENEGGSGGGSTTQATTAAPETVLFPNDGKQETPAPAGQGQPDATEWKEYVPDPAKSAEENAAAKAEHDKAKPADDAAKDDALLDQVPEDGKYEPVVPDGFTLDAEMLGAVSGLMKTKGFTRREAQELVDQYSKIISERENARVEDWGKTVEGWAEEAKKDADIGGDKWQGTVVAAQRAVDQLGTPELKEYLNSSGGGNHKELIRFMAKVGALLSEDRPAQEGAGGSGKPAETAHILFPNDAPKGG